MSGILRLESLTKGNTLKQGDKTPLKYRLFDADGEKLNIAGKSAQVRLVYPDFLTIGYEKDGLTVAQDDTVTFTIDNVIPSRIYHVEIIVDDKFIFPSRADESKFTVDKSSLGTEANIIEIIGVDAVVRKAVDLINEDPNLIIDEDKLVSDIISKTGLGSIEEYYQQFNDVITELSEEKDYHSLPEISAARGGHGTLGDRLDETTAQLAQKANKSGVREDTGTKPINVNEMDTETKQLFTGGAVAVVGKNAVGNENLKPMSVSPFNTNYLDYDLVDGEQIQGEVYALGGSWYVSPGDVPVTTYKFKIKNNSFVSIENFSGANRFRVAVLNDYYNGNQKLVDRLITSDDSKSRVDFYNTKGVEVVVYSANTLIAVSKPIVKQMSKIKSDVPFDITNSVNVEDTTFLTSEKISLEPTLTTGISVYTPEDGKVYLRTTGPSAGTVTYFADVEPYQNVTISLKSGFNNRFRVAVMNTSTNPIGDYDVDRVVNLDNTKKEVKFINDSLGKRVYVYLGLASDNVNATVDIITEKIKPKIPFVNEVERKFKLDYTAILEDTGSPTNRDEYPSMCAVKMDNSRLDEQPRPVGWLYRSNTAPYTFYYSSVTPDNMKEIFEWDSSLAGSTYNTPEYYSPFITKYGDIVFVFRGDRLSALTDNEPINADARRNPIVYPASDYSTPVVVDVGEVKPTAWLQNCGADYIYNQDTFMFSEYTRPLHGNAYVWKVSEPVTSPDSWEISKTFELSGSMNVGMKHCHTMNYDPYSELLFMTTGDDSASAKIFSSADNGVSWQVQMEGSEKHCRVLNFVFKEDKIYWATDSGKVDLHFFFEVPRDPITKVPDFSAIKELYKFKNKSGQQATYVTVSIDKPNGILFLDRYDANTVEPMEIYFWSFETNSMHILDYLTPVGGVAAMFGFRVEAINWYQSVGRDKRIVMGYGHPPNDNALLGNKINNRINNLALEVKEVVDF